MHEKAKTESKSTKTLRMYDKHHRHKVRNHSDYHKTTYLYDFKRIGEWTTTCKHNKTTYYSRTNYNIPLQFNQKFHQHSKM